MGAVLGNPAVLQHDNPVGVPGTVDPLRDDNRRDIPAVFLQGLADLPVCTGIHGAEKINKNQDFF